MKIYETICSCTVHVNHLMLITKLVANVKMVCLQVVRNWPFFLVHLNHQMIVYFPEMKQKILHKNKVNTLQTRHKLRQSYWCSNLRQMGLDHVFRSDTQSHFKGR